MAIAAAGESGECSVDLATGKVVVTGPLADLFGSTDDRRLTLDDLRGHIHPADRQRVADEMAAALDDAAKSAICTRFRVLRQDGSAIWLEVRDRIERDDAGHAVATRGVMRAVTGRKRSKQPDLDWSRFEAALANTSIVVFQQDLALRYTWIHDPRAGFEAQSVLGMTDAELAGPELAGPLDAIKRKVIETGQSARREVTMQGRRARGRYDLYVEPQRDDSGAVVGVTCAAIEIAAERGRRNAPSKLRQAISDRDALLDRLEARSEPGGDRGLFTICTDLLRRKLAGHAPLTREDAALLGLMEKKRRFVPARQWLDIGADRTLLIGNGWVYSYKALATGERQVVGFHLPGDLIGEAQPGKEGISYVAVTDCVVCEFDRAMAMKLRRSETVLPDALRWSDAREAAIVQQLLISIGRRSAIARVAHLLLELGARLKLVGLAEEDGYRCPLSQELLGDALGLTKIHVNRMLRELRELGCLTFRNGRVTYGDMARLIDLADYDPAYLDVSPEPAPNTGLRA
ncbi:MAG TPA: helix-turn-helix domain-containing protein [Aestuariivirgaceae bacterium]|nr:helix-turn-helix domain-containing protein [Aestuariivirgaceae bacterium]